MGSERENISVNFLSKLEGHGTSAKLGCWISLNWLFTCSLSAGHEEMEKKWNRLYSQGLQMDYYSDPSSSIPY